MNGDGRADAVCAGDDGSVRVWEAGEDEAEIYTESWTDERFGFCVQQQKQVEFGHTKPSVLIKLGV